MALVEERLRQAGICPFPGDRPVILPEYARIAGLVARLGVRSVGLVPASDDVGVPVVAVRLAHALAEIGGGVAGVLDAQGTWLPPEPAAGDAGTSAAAPRVVQTKVAPHVLLFTHRPVPGGEAQKELRAVLTGDAGSCPWLVCDLTGLERSGEHLEAMAMLDAVAVVARAGLTTSLQLATRMRDVPAAKNLGVVLIGADEGAAPIPASR